MDNRIGAQYYTLRDSIQTVTDFEETCRKVSKIGYKLVQISGTPLKAADMKPILDKYGLEVVVTHRGWDDFKENLEDIIDYNKTLGCELCGLGSMTADARADEAALDETIQKMNEIGAKLRAEGLYFGYHNHAFEFKKVGGKYIMDRLIQETDPDAVNFIVDVYWLQVGGQSPADFIKKLGKRAMAIHFKDYAVAEDNRSGEMAEIGEGNLDWDSIIAAGKEAGSRWALVEQDVCKRDPFESMKMSYDFLTTKGFC